jgi:uncharacterized membrane protein YeaQ/YmgE (transglycosylase-associated protein family)
MQIRAVHCTHGTLRCQWLRWLGTAKRANFGRYPGRPRAAGGHPASSEQHGSPKGSDAMPIDVIDLVVWLVIGAIAGWLAGQILKGGGFGLIGNIVLGIVGAVVAGWLFPYLGFAVGGPYIAALINALIGSIIVLAVVGFLKRA